MSESDTPFIPQILTPFWQLTVAQREDVLWNYEEAARRVGGADRDLEMARGSDMYRDRFRLHVRRSNEAFAFREYLMRTGWRHEQ